MKSRVVPTLALVTFVALSTPEQAQTPMKASLQGIVVRAGSGEPLADALVTLSVVAPASTSITGPSAIATNVGSIATSSTLAAVESSPAASGAEALKATTGADGRFVFQNLNAGVYRLQAMRNGYARQTYGQRIANGPATAIRLSPGQSVNNLVMTLQPAGNVGGVIRDIDGQPQAGVPIQLLRAAYSAEGQLAFDQAASARTNDRGEYRLYWITPGRYYIAAGTPPGPSRPLNPNSAANANEIQQSYTLTYYPGVLDGRAAAAIDIAPGVEMNGIDFNVARQQLYRVRGRIVDAGTGQPPRSVSVSLAYRTLTGASGAFSAGDRYDPATGEFELRNVPPGFYVVQAIASDAPSPQTSETLVSIAPVAARPNGRMPIAITSEDVNGVQLVLSSGFSISGRLRFEGAPFSSIPGWERIRVQLKPTVNSVFTPNLQPAAPVAQSPAQDGSFAIHGVAPGEFTLGPVTGLPGGVYIKEARLNQTDVATQTMRFAGPLSGTLEILLSSKTGQVEGQAVDAQSRTAAGAQVVLIPDRQRDRRDLYRTATTDRDGRFRLSAVPPGDYRAFAWEALESYAYFDPELQRRVESYGAPVHISESAPNNVTVRLIPATY